MTCPHLRTGCLSFTTGAGWTDVPFGCLAETGRLGASYELAPRNSEDAAQSGDVQGGVFRSLVLMFGPLNSLKNVEKTCFVTGREASDICVF